MKKVWILTMAMLIAATAWSADVAVDRNGVAIYGYDPVSYFLGDGPVLGDPAIRAEWEGVTWHFASESNRRLFVADPESYAPAFGGFCAGGLSDGSGHIIAANPENYRIIDGELFLFFSSGGARRFESDSDRRIDLAAENFERLR